MYSKLNSNHEDSSSNYEKKQISKSFLGFFIISIFFIAFILFYLNRDYILDLNNPFSDQMSFIINATDLLINNLKLLDIGGYFILLNTLSGSSSF